MIPQSIALTITPRGHPPFVRQAIAESSGYDFKTNYIFTDNIIGTFLKANYGYW